MKYSKKINYLIIVSGCAVSIYARAEEEQNLFVLILGIVILMFGLYRISSTIPHKKNKNEENNF